MAWGSLTGALWRVSLSGDRDFGNHIWGNMQTVTSVVSSAVACDQSEVRWKRNRVTARSRGEGYMTVFVRFEKDPAANG